MSEHSRLSPSSMDRILKCPGSAVHDPPDRGSKAADDGSLAHKFGERILRGEGVEDGDFTDEDMRSSVFEYVAYIRSHKAHDELANVDHENSQLLIEERIVSESNPDHGGTMDALIVSDSHIHVNDFKYGLWAVDPHDNKQILSYLSLANERYPGRERFFGSIVQPRVFGATECVEYALDEVESHDLDVLLAGGSDELVVGSHCKWCPLKLTCKALDAKRKELASTAFDDESDGEVCKEIIEWGSVFVEQVKEAKRRILKLMMDGELVEGWRLAESLGNRTWIDEEKAITKMLELKIPSKAMWSKKIKSPAQLEKFSKAYGTFVESMCHRPRKGVIAVTDDSKLPAYQPGDIFDDDIFEGLD